MAQSFSLAYYCITLNKRFTKDLAILSDFYQGGDYFDIINTIVASWVYDSKVMTINRDESHEKVFRIKKDENGKDMLYRQGRFLSGIIETGDYGSEEPVVDINTGKSTYTKGIHESLLKPFYFLFFIPRNSVYGFLILERIGTLGIYTIINEALMSYFKGEELLDLSLKVLPLTSTEANKKYRQLIDYEARQITLHNVRKDALNISKMSDNTVEDKVVGSIDIVYNAPVGKKMNIGRWLKFLRKDEAGLYGVEETGKYSDIDFTVEINGKPKKLSYNKMDSLGTVFDITGAVSNHIVKGYPSFSAINKEAMDVISDLIKQFNITQ